MKKLFCLFIALSIVFGFSKVYSDIAAEYRITHVLPGMGNGYNYVCEPKGISCPGGSVNDCMVEDAGLGGYMPIIWHDTGLGWSLQILSNDLKLTNMNTDSSIVISPYNFTFSSSASVRITNSTEHPEYDGVTINLDGISTDGSGYFYVFIPY